ncbi:MAG: hypothetical protein ACRDTS_07785 [Mycobacterium sp.]
MTQHPQNVSFSIHVPDGFMPITAGLNYNVRSELETRFATMFSISADHVGVRSIVDLLSELGVSHHDSGIDFSAIGLFRSPDEPDRPVSALLTCARMAASNESNTVTLSGLRELHEREPNSRVMEIEIQAGRCIAVVKEFFQSIPADEDKMYIVSARQVTVWVPNPDGSSIAVVSIISNSIRDWPNVCDTALDVFNSIAWEEIEGFGADAPR